MTQAIPTPWLYVVGVVGTLAPPFWLTLNQCIELVKPAKLTIAKRFVFAALAWDMFWASLSGIIAWSVQKTASVNLNTKFIDLRQASSPRAFALLGLVLVASVGTGIGARQLAKRVRRPKPLTGRSYDTMSVKIDEASNPKTRALKAIGSCRDEWVTSATEHAMTYLVQLGLDDVVLRAKTFLRVRALRSPLGKNTSVLKSSNIANYVNEIATDPGTSDNEKMSLLVVLMIENDGYKTVCTLIRNAGGEPYSEGKA